MLPGFSSKNNYCNNNNNDQIGGAKKSKKHSDLHEDDDNEFGEILLQYNLEQMNEEKQYDFSHCDTHRDTYPFASSLSKDTDALFDIDVRTAASYESDGSDGYVDSDGFGTDFPFMNGNHYVKANINFYLRNEGQFLQGTLGASANKGIGNFLFSGRNRKQFAYNYWCFPVGNAPAGSGNEDFGITMFNVATTNIFSYAFSNAALSDGIY